jgi:hypothetical protein
MRKIDQVRKDLIKKAKGEMEVLHGRSAKAIWIRSCQGWDVKVEPLLGR